MAPYNEDSDTIQYTVFPKTPTLSPGFIQLKLN